MGALSLTRRVGGPVENWIIFGSVRNRGKSCRLSDANSMTHLRARTPAEIRHLATRAAFPQRRSSNANTLCGQNSAGFLQICKTFKGIICDDISEFESYMPSQPVPSLCAMVKLTYGRANRDKVSPPDTLTIAAQERRTPRGKSAPTQICWKPPTALPGGIVFANRNFVLSWGDLETPRVYHAARQRGLRVSLCKRGGARGILRSGSR